MNSNLSVTATFSPNSEGANPTTLNLGTVGGCPGGQISGSFQVSAPAGVQWSATSLLAVAWTWIADPDQDTITVSPLTGTGPGTITVTITAAPQTPLMASDCQNPDAYTFTGPINVQFSDTGVIATVNVTWTFNSIDF
jgi:hypothetical protein